MKKTFSWILIILGIATLGSAGLVMAAGGASWSGGDPTVRTVGVESITGTTVTMKAFYDSLDIDYNSDDSPSLSIEYGPNGNMMFSTQSVYQLRGSRTEPFPVKDLTQNTSYSYRAVLFYNNKTAYGDIKTFYTTNSPTTGTIDNSTDSSNTSTPSSGSSSSNQNSSTVTTSSTSSTSLPWPWSWFSGSSKKTTTAPTTAKINRPSSLIRDGIKLSLTDATVRTRTRDALVYVIDYANVSKQDLRNVQVELLLPIEYAFESSTKGQYYANTHSVVTDLRTLNRRETGKISVLVNAVGVKSNSYTEAQARLYHENGVYTVYDTDEYIAGTGRVTSSAAASGSGLSGSTMVGWLIIGLIIAGLVFASYRYFKTS